MNHYVFKEYLESQLELCKEKDYIIEQMEFRLHKMRAITISRLEDILSTVEIEELNEQLNELEEELQFLEQQLESAGEPTHNYLH